MTAIDKPLNLENINPAEKRLILWAEIGALLHDIGKLSNIFLEYRQGWQKCQAITDPEAKAAWGDHWHWGNDPHDHGFLEFDYAHGKLAAFGELWKCLSQKRFEDLRDGPGFTDTIKDLIDKHTEINPQPIISILKTSDIKDAADNRHDPLFSCDQLGNKVFIASPFGFEGEERRLNPQQDEIRKKLYIHLEKLLPDYWSALNKCTNDWNNIGDLRCEILEKCREAFCQGISDTCRPAHDISLWDHSYGTACLFKAFMAFLASGYNILSPDAGTREEIEQRAKEYADSLRKEDSKFTLLGFGWDGLSYLEKGEKIGDSLGRELQLNRLKKKLRTLVEVEFCVGNRMYEDENGIYFLIPRLGKEGGKADDAIGALSTILHAANEHAARITSQELPIYLRCKPTTQYLFEIVTVMEDLRQRWSSPWSSEAAKGFLNHKWQKDSEVCPVCQLRPVKETATEKNKVCKECGTIRADASREIARHAKGETIFTGEIARSGDKNFSNKAALVVGCFGLREWLNGNMLYSIFIKPPERVEAHVNHLKKILDSFAEDEKRHKSYQKSIPELDEFIHSWKASGKHINYEFIEHLIARLPDPSGTGPDSAGTAFRDLFFYHINRHRDDVSLFKNFLSDLNNLYDAPVSLANFLLTQNHTPSRLLAIWQETEGLFREAAAKLPSFLKDQGFPAQTRARLVLDNFQTIQKKNLQGVHTFTLTNGQRLEAIYGNEEFLTVNCPYRDDLRRELDGLEIIEVRGENEREKQTHGLQNCRIIEVTKSSISYYPYRTLLVSPLVFMAMVPGNVAAPLVQNLKDEYDQRFAKVKGRLPFSLGLVFFREHTPMFAVLDAGKRIVRNFEKLHNQEYSFSVRQTGPQSSTYTLHQLDGKQAIFPESISPDSPEMKSDPHFPYALVQESLKNRSTFFSTHPGHVIHFREVQPGDHILARPNYLDLVFLDATTRRFDLYFPANESKRPSAASHLTPTFPYYLDELEDITGLWDHLKESRISDTALRGLETLLLSKLAEWQGAGPLPWESPVWRRLVRSAVGRTFPREYHLEMEEAICNGLFFDTLELYLRILKVRLGGDQ